MTSIRTHVERRLRAAARDQRGGVIVEVMVGAVVLVMVALGTLSAFDGAAKVSATTKTRAMAANLAQEEQERIRGLSVAQLNGLRYSTTQAIGGVTYTIASRTDWLADASSTTSCASNGAAADYLKATTTVTPNKGLTKPVTLTTLVTPTLGTFSSTQGSLGVSVLDRAGAGIPNVSVSATGPTSGSSTTSTDTTDSAGCVFFGYLAAGPYDIDFTLPGYVDKNGNAPTPKSTGNTVTGESTSTQSFTVDQAGSANVTFNTVPAGGSAQASKAGYVTFDNSGLATPRIFGNGTLVSSYATGLTLFPFTGAYGIYAGNCTGANPSTSPNTGTLVTGTVPRGGAVSPAPVLRVPAINVTVQKGGVAQSGLNVKITPKTSGCSGTVTTTTNSSGKLADPGMPYGTYDVCAWTNVSGTNRKETATNKANTAPTGVAAFTINLTSGDTSGTC